MTNLTNNIIPEKTIERLSAYRRSLMDCYNIGMTHIFSHTLADILGITAVQVRRDLMLIGFSSDTKKGYDVEILINFIGNILDNEAVVNIGVVGMGNLGRAVTKYFHGKRSKLKIVASFDVDENKVGKVIDEIQCYHISEFRNVVREHNIDIIILSLPTNVASDMVEPIIEANIQGVLNFTSIHLHFPEHIYVEEYDIITLMEKVCYFAKEKNSKK